MISSRDEQQVQKDAEFYLLTLSYQLWSVKITAIKKNEGTESTIENNAVRESLSEGVTFRETHDYSDGLSHSILARKSKQDLENSKCNIGSCL